VIKPKPGALFMQAWVKEISGVARVERRPSWIARKMSTHPPLPAPSPVPSMVPRASIHVPREDRAASTPVPQPPLPPSIDLTASIALAQLRDENAALRAQVAEMAGTMARLRREVLEASEGELVMLALTIAERVVARELRTDPALVAAWAREAIEKLAAKDGVVIAVAKDVRDELPDDTWNVVGAPHRVQTDGQLPPGAIEVRTPEGTVAAHAEARFAAVAHALGVVDP
jgi:hypothetical protein